ncbi:MAG: hypothetical protein LBL43_01175, partial [Treponema sp.]|nr:hypothetical protein [Treponema sp.]
MIISHCSIRFRGPQYPGFPEFSQPNKEKMFEQTFQVEAEKPMNHRFLERPRVDRILERAMQSHIVTVIA